MDVARMACGAWLVLTVATETGIQAPATCVYYYQRSPFFLAAV
jgi:hypothetical protein